MGLNSFHMLDKQHAKHAQVGFNALLYMTCQYSALKDITPQEETSIVKFVQLAIAANLQFSIQLLAQQVTTQVKVQVFVLNAHSAFLVP